MLALVIASVLSREQLYSNWRAPLVALAFFGFVVAVVGHLVQSRTAIVTGILLVFLAVLIFPILLFLRGGA